MENNNKLIAEFMGNHTDEYGNDVYVPKEMMFNSKSKCMQGIFEFNECKFHTDWNWLMPVVVKILDISLESDSMEPYYNITDSIPNIKETYKEVIEFINWYNENK